mgnify:CR=1 FL=1
MSGLSRRGFLGAAAGIAAAGVAAPARGSILTVPLTEERRQAVVIGSGFGGGVTARRLGRAGVKTLVLERRPFQIEEDQLGGQRPGQPSRQARRDHGGGGRRRRAGPGRRRTDPGNGDGNPQPQPRGAGAIRARQPEDGRNHAGRGRPVGNHRRSGRHGAPRPGRQLRRQEHRQDREYLRGPDRTPGDHQKQPGPVEKKSEPRLQQALDECHGLPQPTDRHARVADRARRERAAHRARRRRRGQRAHDRPRRSAAPGDRLERLRDGRRHL